jgi:hypothetical protein
MAKVSDMKAKFIVHIHWTDGLRQTEFNSRHEADGYCSWAQDLGYNSWVQTTWK